MKFLILIFLTFFILTQGNTQQFFCTKKNGYVTTNDSQNFEMHYNYKPIASRIFVNGNIYKSIEHRYKQYSRFFKRDLPIKYYPCEQSDSIQIYTNKVFYSAANNILSTLPYMKLQSVPFFLDSNHNIYTTDNGGWYTIYTGMFVEPMFPISKFNIYCIQYKDSNHLVFFDSCRYVKTSTDNSLDSNVRQPLQFYSTSKNELYIMDENNYYNIINGRASGIKYDVSPKITVVNSINAHFIKNIPEITNITSRLVRDNNNMKYNNFTIQNNKLYLSYSYKNKDSLGIFNLDKNVWEQRIKLTDTNYFEFFGYRYSPFGYSRVQVSKNSRVYIAETKGNIYELNMTDFSKRIIDTMNSATFGFMDEFTKTFCVDGFENVYIPDFKNGKILKYMPNFKEPKVLVDSIFMDCLISSPIQYSRFAPTNLQIDGNGNIYAEIDPIDSNKFLCATKYHVKWDNLIDTSFSLNEKLKCSDTLKIVSYFMDGDSIVNIITKPPCYISKSLQINSCDSYNFNKKTYYQSGIFTDTIVSSTKPDTIYTLNLIINKSKFDTIKVQTCNTFKFGDSIYSKSGIYTHKFTSKNGCDSLSTLILDSKEINAKIKLENGIYYTALTPNASYQWYYCYPWRRITNAQNQTFSTTTKGSYAVVVSRLGCADTSDCVALYSSGIESLNQNNIQIFPNPIQDNFTIQFGNEHKENSVEIYNALGQKIKSFNTKLNEIQVDMKDESRGIYLIKVNEIQVYKIIKE
jgi:hypothetical protein